MAEQEPRKLETLNDVGCPRTHHACCQYEMREVMKTAAIEWIKELRTVDSYCIKCHVKHDLSNCTCDEKKDGVPDFWIHNEDCEGQEVKKVIQWIKHFFNITEEEFMEKEGDNSGKEEEHSA